MKEGDSNDEVPQRNAANSQEEGSGHFSYIDCLLSAVAGDDIDGNSDDEYSDGGEYGDDEDALEYDSDEDMVITAFRRAAATEQQNASLSTEGQEQLAWRLAMDKNFSDWTIKVTMEGGGAEQTYHVHRLPLALGPRKCGYFESLFNSSRFRECNERTTQVTLSKEDAAAFPSFLDYLYAPLSECYKVISSENALALQRLACYFMVPKLKESVYEFISRDIKNLEHMEKYLSEMSTSDVDDETQARLLTILAQVCVERFADFQLDQGPLYMLPPAIVLHVIITLRWNSDLPTLESEHQNRVCQLAMAYCKTHKDVLGFDYIYELANAMCFPKNETQAGERVIDVLEVMKDLGWNKARFLSDCDELRDTCVDVLCKYLRIREFTPHEMQARVLERIPSWIAAEVFSRTLRSLKAATRG